LKKLPWWVAVSCLAALALSLYPLAERHKAEAENRALGLAVEWSNVVDLATVQGGTPLDALDQLKAQGVGALVFQEQTVGELQAEGRVVIDSSPTGAILFGSPDVLGRIQAFALYRFPGGTILPSPEQSKPSLQFVGSVSELRSLSLGIEPEGAAFARQAGFEIICRHSNVLGAGASYVRAMLRSSASLGSQWFLPSGDQIIGRRAAEKETGDILAGLSMYYVTPEFVKMAGDAVVRGRIPDRTLRLHSIQAAEIDRLSPAAVVERYSKAFRERNIRWLLLRPVSQGEDRPLDAFLELAGQVRRGAEDEGAVIKTPRPFNDPWVPDFWYPLMHLAALPLIFWAGQRVLGQGRLAWAVGGLGALLAASSFLESGRSLAALAAAVAFPVAAYAALEQEDDPHPLIAFGVMVVMSLAGGLMVSGSLIGVEWMIQNDQFSGIKAAHFLPVGVAGFILLRMQKDLKEAAEEPILWKTTVLGVVGAAALAFMLSRTGNDNPAGVSGLELQFRSLLDRVLYTRPRTKEFLIGHPALIMGLFLWHWSVERRSLRPWAGLLMTLGAIGLTSMVNTLCHLHTPVELSLARIAIGLAIGGILGLLGAAALKLAKVDRTPSRA
jgi:hypothetical protein